MAQPQRQGIASPKTAERSLARSIHEKKLLGMIRRQLPVDARYAGAFSVPLTELTLKKIGSTALDVYDALLQSRDLNCTTHASLAGITRKACAPIAETNGWPRPKLTEKTVRNAIEKLIRLGLVENLGWTYRVVPCADATCRAAGLPPAHDHKVFLRRIKGLVTVKPETPELFHLVAPKETVDELKKAGTHGGARAGVGRPVGAKDSKPRRRFRDPTLDMPVETFDRGPTPVAPLAGAVRGAGENQDGRPIKSITKISSSVLRTSEEKPAPKAPGAGVVSSSEKSPSKGAPVAVATSAAPASTPAPSKPPALPDEPVAGSRYLNRNPDVGGLRLGGESRGLRGLVVYAPRQEDQWTPPFPGPSVVSPPRVPEPPQLPADLAPDDKAALVARAYRTTISARYGFRCMTLANVGDIEQRKEFKDLAASADLLVAHRIPPIAWVAWSVDVWRHFGKSNRPPSIRWVFNPQRIEKWHGWFHSEQQGYRGGQLVPVPALRELYFRFEKMRFAIIRGAEQAAAVAQHLPRHEYERLLAEARMQIAEIQLDLNRKVQAGHFLW